MKSFNPYGDESGILGSSETDVHLGSGEAIHARALSIVLARVVRISGCPFVISTVCS